MKLLKKILKIFASILLVLLTLFIILLIIPEKEVITPIKVRKNTAYWKMEEGFNIAYTKLEGIDSLQKPAVIFLHGGPGGYVHSSIIETLSHLTNYGYDVYLYDQRGSGLSDRLDKYSDISFEKHLIDLDEIISKKIKANKVILIGQSFGSNIISHYSVRHPEKISKIVFSSPGTFKPHKKIQDSYADLNAIYPVPDSLKFKEPYNFNKDVDYTAFKPKAMIASTGALLFNKKLISDKQADRMLNTLASKFTKGMVCDLSLIHI